jgi:hypothetical protein
VQVWNSGADTVYHYDGKSASAGGHAIICFGYDNAARYWLCECMRLATCIAACFG